MLPTNLRGSAPVRLATTQPIQRMPMVIMAQGSPLGVASSPAAPVVQPIQSATGQAAVRPATTNPKEHAVRLPRTDQKYGVMEFASGIVVDLKDGNKLEMKREINPYTYRAATTADSNSNPSNTIVTSSGAVLPKTGAGSEYGREQKEALKRKRFASKGTNLEDLPWVLSNYLSNEKRIKHYRGMKKGGIKDNSAYYIFIQNKDSFDAFPVDDWHSFTPTNVYKTLDFDEAEQKYQDRHKTLSKWMNTHRPTKTNDEEPEEDVEKGKKRVNSKLNEFKLLDTDEFNAGNESDEDDEDEDNEDEDKKGSSKKKSTKKSKKGETNLSDDDEDEPHRSKFKKQKTKQKEKRNEQAEDSDDGDHEEDEIDYTSDESSEEEDDIRDVGTAKALMKYEVKGIDEELKTMPDINKKLDQLDDNGEGIDFDDDDDEELQENEENEEENGKGNGDDLKDVEKLLKNDAISKEIGSSSDDDEMDDSDDPDKETIETTNSASSLQPIPSQQIKTEKGHKKAKEEEIRALKSQVMSMTSSTASSSSTEPWETITEEKVRHYLSRGPMTTNELIHKFLPKGDHQRTKEMKNGIVQKLAIIIKQIPVEHVKIDTKSYIKLKK